MTTESTHEGKPAQQAPGWLLVTDAVLAGCSIGAAVLWLWVANAEGIAIITSILLVLTALAFVLARHALKKNWPGQWFLQILGPAMVIFLLFGTVPAVASALLAALLTWLVRRKSSSPRNAA